jgi:hypothetical protein
MSGYPGDGRGHADEILCNGIKNKTNLYAAHHKTRKIKRKFNLEISFKKHNISVKKQQDKFKRYSYPENNQFPRRSFIGAAVIHALNCIIQGSFLYFRTHKLLSL